MNEMSQIYIQCNWKTFLSQSIQLIYMTLLDEETLMLKKLWIRLLEPERKKKLFCGSYTNPFFANTSRFNNFSSYPMCLSFHLLNNLSIRINKVLASWYTKRIIFSSPPTIIEGKYFQAKVLYTALVIQSTQFSVKVSNLPKEETWYTTIKYFIIIPSPPRKQN